ncbi:hypothetical protein NDI39_08085 [Microcoleus sp. ZQ-A2]|nr:hypothetical protein [Microcoleus sp. FACHB-1]
MRHSLDFSPLVIWKFSVKSQGGACLTVRHRFHSIELEEFVQEWAITFIIELEEFEREEAITLQMQNNSHNG